MSLSFLKPGRAVLLVSDEFLSIYTVGSNGVRLVETVPWGAENFVNNVASIIAKDCGRRPLLILNDMVEQHYRKERVIRAGVSFMDRSALLKRKLNVAFPNYPIRAAYPLKEKAGKAEKKVASDIYIFAAVPSSDQFTKTIESSRKSMASLAAMCLLPIESSDMVKALAAKASSKKPKGKNSWAVFIGQHRNGSLRQVLTKNGELALTRMSPIIDTDEDPHAWATELHQELQATISYLSRFGYDPEDGLDVFVVANPAAGEALEGLIEQDYNLHIMTVGDTAKLLGLTIGFQEDQRYADALHVAWAGNKNKFLLPMKATQVDEVSRPRQAAMVAALALMGGVAFLGYQTVSFIGQVAHFNDEIDNATRKKSQMEAQYQREVQRLDELGFDARLVQNSLLVYGDLEKQKIKLLTLFGGVGKALGKDLRIDGIDVQRIAKPQVTQVFGGGEPPPVRSFEAKMKITYPSTADIDKGNKEVEDLRGRIQSLLPDHEVKVSKLLQDYEYTEGLIVETGDLEKENVKQDFVAEIMVRGPLIE